MMNSLNPFSDSINDLFHQCLARANPIYTFIFLSEYQGSLDYSIESEICYVFYGQSHYKARHE